MLAPALAWGQAAVTGTGTIIGTVMDPSGAVIVGAQVTITDPATGSFQGQPTNQVGRFIFASVKPGTYDVTVTMKGFRKLVLPGRVVGIGSQLNLPLTLEVGAAIQTVEVTAAPGAELQTLNATMGTGVVSTQLLLIPSSDRDAATVLYFVPTAAPNFHGAQDNTTSGQIAGMTSDQNTYYLDGGNNTSGLEGDNNYVAGGHGVMPMPMESIQEFKVNTNNMTADFSMSSGAEVLLTTKRGTNAFHGSAYEYYQGSVLNSNDWFNNTRGIAKSKSHSNRFGGAVGGPVHPGQILGGKTFFYFNYEGYRYPRSAAEERFVPSDLMRQGIVQFRDATGTPVQYNLKTSTQCGLNGGMPCDPRGIGLNPVAKQLWDTYLPEPNDPKCTDLNSKCYYGNLSYPLKNDFFVVRLDHDFGSKWRGFGSFRWFKETNPNTRQVDFGGLVKGNTKGQFASASNQPRQPRFFVLGLTGNPKPTVTNEFHFSYTRGFWSWAQAGAVPQIPGIPGALEFGENSNWVPMNNDTQNTRQRLWNEHDFDFRDTLSWIRGNHFFQFGGDYLHQWWHFDRYDNVVSGLTQLVYQMARVQGNPIMTTDVQPVPCPKDSTTATNCLPTTLLTSWNNMYANMLGMIGQSAIVVSRQGANLELKPLGTPASAYAIVPTYSLYFNDSWHIRPNLTLTYGLNYGVQMPPYEINGTQDIMVDASNTPINAEGYLASKMAAANKGQIYAPAIGYTPVRAVGGAGGWKYPYPPFYGGWGPRVSIAYSPGWDSGIMGKLFGHKSTVIRGGYSRIYDRSLGINLVSSAVLGDGFLQPVACRGATITGQCLGSSSVTPTTEFRIGVDGNVPPLGNIADTLQTPVMPGVNAPAVSLGATLDTQYRPGSSDQIDFSIQRQLKGNMILELGYVGRWAKHQFAGIDINDVPYMMKLNGQTFATAWDNLYLQVTGGKPVTQQPFFEAALAGSSYCKGHATCTAAVAVHERGYITSDDVMDLWSDLDSSFVFGPNTTPAQNQSTWTYNDTSMGFSNYHAAVATLIKRAGHGLTFNGNFTYSHSLGEFNLNQMYTLANPENPWDLRTDYSPQPWDRKFVVNFLGTYELPFGKGRRWASSNPVLTRLLGGWSLTPIFTWASGTPIESYSGSCYEWGNGWGPWCAGMVPMTDVLKYGNSAHPHVYGSEGIAVNGDPANGGVGMNMFADPVAVYNNNRMAVLGIDGRSYDYGPIRGQKRWNVDLSLTKDTKITERLGFTVSAEMFNVLNHMQWGDPGLNLQDPANFGVISNEYSYMGNRYNRVIQLGVRVHF